MRARAVLNLKAEVPRVSTLRISLINTGINLLSSFMQHSKLQIETNLVIVIIVGRVVDNFLEVQTLGLSVEVSILGHPRSFGQNKVP